MGGDSGMLDFRNTKIDLRRQLCSYGKVQLVVSTVLRGRRAFVKEPLDGAYLNVGCGTYTHPDFCNLDYNWVPGIDICWDITRGLPIKSCSIGGIFSEHCL